jgi:type I restriction enzyme M protein
MELQQANRASLGRYFTSEAVGHLLVATMAALAPRIVLDLGSGKGSLSMAALQRWRRARLIGVDVDTDIGRRPLSAHLWRPGQHSIVRADALAADIERHLKVKPRHVDVVVCNPPYRILPWKKHYTQIMEEAGLRLAKEPKQIPAEIAFIAQNLRFLKAGGEAGFILPSSLISGEKYVGFREALLQEFSIQSVIQLGTGAFSGTEARAHILTLTKKKPQNDIIELLRFEKDRGLTGTFSVTSEEAAVRMDYEYFAARRGCGRDTHYSRLESLVDSICRGRLSSRQIREERMATFHLCDFASAGQDRTVSLRGSRGLELIRKNEVVARKGDILVGRVGRNIETQVVFVKSGEAILSDCVYRIRCSLKWQSRVLSGLTSERGRILIRSAMRGSAAQFISKADLSDIRI